MTLTFNALCYLHAWDNRLEFPNGGLAFEPLLRRIEPDYSVGSLARIDTFLDALRTTKKPQRDAFLAQPPNQNLLYLLAFYVGEVIGRALGGAPRWLTHEECVRMDHMNAAFGDGFESSARCLFPNTPARVAFFGPLPAISSRLFEGPASKSVGFSAGAAFPEGFPVRRGPLAPVALSPWPVDIRRTIDAMTFDERTGLALAMPRGIERDPLARVFDAAMPLLKEGRVVWAAFVQANSDLFEPRGQFPAAPAEVVYDPLGRMPPEDLSDIASHLFRLKGQKPQDPIMARYGAHLAAETSRAFGFDVPAAISPYPLKASTVWLQRSHMPGGRLSQKCFPALVHESQPGVVMFLPAPFWPRHLLEAWA